MVCGDANYCSVKQRCYSDEHIKRTNKCKDFEFNPIDALGENEKGYQPRQKKQKPLAVMLGEQMNMFFHERK